MLNFSRPAGTERVPSLPAQESHTPPQVIQRPYTRCAVLFVAAICSSAPLACFAADAEFSPEQVEFFEKKIRPVLAENCYE